VFAAIIPESQRKQKKKAKNQEKPAIAQAGE
jgi:hypothetical protein